MTVINPNVYISELSNELQFSVMNKFSLHKFTVMFSMEKYRETISVARTAISVNFFKIGRKIFREWKRCVFCCAKKFQ